MFLEHVCKKWLRWARDARPILRRVRSPSSFVFAVLSRDTLLIMSSELTRFSVAGRRERAWRRHTIPLEQNCSANATSLKKTLQHVDQLNTNDESSKAPWVIPIRHHQAEMLTEQICLVNEFLLNIYRIKLHALLNSCVQTFIIPLKTACPLYEYIHLATKKIVWIAILITAHGKFYLYRRHWYKFWIVHLNELQAVTWISSRNFI